MLLRTFIAAVIGLSLTWILARSTAAGKFREMRWSIMLSAALLWGGLTTTLVIAYWDSYFTFFKPDWMRWWNPPLAAGFYSLVGLLLWWLAGRSRRNPALLFCILGGLWSIPEHVLAIYRFDILNIPLLQDINPAQILVFSFFEYIIFWSLVLGLAALLRRLWHTHPPESNHQI